MSWAEDSKPTVSIEPEYLMTIDAPLDPASQFVVGHRLIVNVPNGGTVNGPKIHGGIIVPAGDWLYLKPDASRDRRNRRLDFLGTLPAAPATVLAGAGGEG
jgi:hypothetical protein